MDLSLGEPDFATPGHVGRAGVKAIEAGRTKYTDVAGEAALRDAIGAKYAREQSAGVDRENVIVTAGAKQAVFNVCTALFDEGDEVALFSPYWVSFPEMVRLTGARPVFVETSLDDGWHPSAAALSAAGPSVRGVIVNSPNNPTGAVVGAGSSCESSTGAPSGPPGSSTTKRTIAFSTMDGLTPRPSPCARGTSGSSSRARPPRLSP